MQRSAVHDVLSGSGQPLAAPLKEEMEARLGADFSQVRVHTGDAARASAAEVGARAYTSGDHVVIGDGGADKHTLAHELTHVIQQRQGPVAGTDHGDGLTVSDPLDVYEKAAEANAARVTRPSTVPALPIPEVRRRSGRPLARPVSQEMEGRPGADFSQVRVHTDGAADASAAELSARAYTWGSHVGIGDTGAGGAVGPVLQRLVEKGEILWSTNHHYAVDKQNENELGIADGVVKPELTGAVWSSTNKTEKFDGGRKVNMYKLLWVGKGNNVVWIPKDCISAAELVAAWLQKQDPEVIGEVKVKPDIEPATETTTVQPGDILFHVHSEDEGQFHAAAVIAQDNGDAVTMEGDTSGNVPIIRTKPKFDMYEGHAGFKAKQTPPGYSGTGEKTYVISFLQGGRSTAVDTLWSGIEEASQKGDWGKGLEAAERIKKAIQEALQQQQERSKGEKRKGANEDEGGSKEVKIEEDAGRSSDANG